VSDSLPNAAACAVEGVSEMRTRQIKQRFMSTPLNGKWPPPTIPAGAASAFKDSMAKSSGRLSGGPSRSDVRLVIGAEEEARLTGGTAAEKISSPSKLVIPGTELFGPAKCP
jgi:hypothetical protein